MTIRYCLKTHAVLVQGTSDAYYNDPALNPTLATAERFLLTARVTAATETTTDLTIDLETSNDDVNWYTGTTITPSTAVNLADPLVWWETAESAVSGRFVRVSARLGGTSLVAAYVEVWVCGRSFY